MSDQNGSLVRRCGECGFVVPMGESPSPHWHYPTCSFARHAHEKALALLKSIAAPCTTRWETCRHCLAIEELNRTDGAEAISTAVYELQQFAALLADRDRLQTNSHYSEEQRCCTICDARKQCHVCGAQTRLACSDCQINFHATVYVCQKPDCRREHERKCFGDGSAERDRPTPTGARWAFQVLSDDDIKRLHDYVKELGCDVDAGCNVNECSHGEECTNGMTLMALEELQSWRKVRASAPAAPPATPTRDGDAS